jgi:hypothetical protein
MSHLPMRLTTILLAACCALQVIGACVLATAGIALMSLGDASATVAAVADSSRFGDILVGGAAVFYSMHVIRLGTSPFAFRPRNVCLKY